MVEGWIRTRMMGGVCRVQVQVGGVSARVGDGVGGRVTALLCCVSHCVAFFTTLGQPELCRFGKLAMLAALVFIRGPRVYSALGLLEKNKNIYIYIHKYIARKTIIVLCCACDIVLLSYKVLSSSTLSACIIRVEFHQLARAYLSMEYKQSTVRC